MGGVFGQIIGGLNRDLKTLDFGKVKKYLKNFPTIIKNAPREAVYGYYAVFGGMFLILLQFIIWMLA